MSGHSAGQTVNRAGVGEETETARPKTGPADARPGFLRRLRPHLPADRVLAVVFYLVLPLLLGGLVAGLTGLLPWWGVAAGAGGMALCCGLIVRRHVRTLYDLRGYADQLIGGDTALPGSARDATPAVRDLAHAIHRLYQAKRDEGTDLRRLVLAREGLLDAVPDPIFAFDDQRRIQTANQAARTLFGPLLAGRDLTGILRHPDILAAIDAVVAGGRSGSARFELAHPVERVFHVQVLRLPHPSPDGSIGMLAMHEITALIRTERMQGDFVANASHEIRTPLASILGFIETLRGPAKDDRDAHDRFLAIMEDQAHRMARLVNGLLSLSRIEQREHQPPTDPVPLVEIVRRTVSALDIQARARHVTLSVTAAEDGLSVIGDGDELAQLTQNLVENAIKYGRDGGVVQITISAAPRLPPAMPPTMPPGGRSAVQLVVQDQGPGIPREHLPRLTERFYRVDPARAKAEGSSGLGLAIVKHIVNRHRGALTIESEPGQGSRFTVYLPRAV